MLDVVVIQAEVGMAVWHGVSPLEMWKGGGGVGGRRWAVDVLSVSRVKLEKSAVSPGAWMALVSIFGMYRRLNFAFSRRPLHLACMVNKQPRAAKSAEHTRVRSPESLIAFIAHMLPGEGGVP